MLVFKTETKTCGVCGAFPYHGVAVAVQCSSVQHSCNQEIALKILFGEEEGKSALIAPRAF